MDDWEGAFRGRSKRRRKRIDWQSVRLQVAVLAIVAMVVAAGLIALRYWS